MNIFLSTPTSAFHFPLFLSSSLLSFVRRSSPASSSPRAQSVFRAWAKFVIFSFCILGQPVSLNIAHDCCIWGSFVLLPASCTSYAFGEACPSLLPESFFPSLSLLLVSCHSLRQSWVAVLWKHDCRREVDSCCNVIRYFDGSGNSLLLLCLCFASHLFAVLFLEACSSLFRL